MELKYHFIDQKLHSMIPLVYGLMSVTELILNQIARFSQKSSPIFYIKVSGRVVLRKETKVEEMQFQFRYWARISMTKFFTYNAKFQSNCISVSNLSCLEILFFVDGQGLVYNFIIEWINYCLFDQLSKFNVMEVRCSSIWMAWRT